MNAFLSDSPTKSLSGPTSIEFQLNETCDGQLVKPSQCLLVSTTYLRLKNMTITTPYKQMQ